MDKYFYVLTNTYATTGTALSEWTVVVDTQQRSTNNKNKAMALSKYRSCSRVLVVLI